ncbi:MAG: sulfatase [Planctomycetota bacterium]
MRVRSLAGLAITAVAALSASADDTCNCADIAEPIGVINAADVQALAALAEAGDTRADAAQPFGSVDYMDIVAMLDLIESPPPRPNILWLTFEDTSWFTLPAYGETGIQTPQVDNRLFGQGLRFDRAWSTAPVCSPARSTIISGSYATTYGSDVHRQTINIPDGEYFFPRILRDNGYFATNNRKTDYNSVQSAQAWDENGSSATWRSSARAGRPFFSVYNADMTHTGRIRSWHLDDRRDFAAAGISVTLPPHVPDVPEMRSDYAFHLEGVRDTDIWAGIHLNALRSGGVEDDTIVFFFSDHGGLLPRGKGFVFETGLRVPFGIRVPGKYRCQLPEDLRLPEGSGTERLIGFVDLAATVLSIAGIEPPEYMQGKAFMGPHAEPPRDYQFGFVANREWHFAPDRAVTDGEWKYIRRFIPHRTHGLRNSYQWGMPAWVAWDEYVHEGDPAAQNELWMRPYTPGSDATGAEMLFNISTDPFELTNLADDPAHEAKLIELRDALGQHMRDTQDLGLFPRNMRDDYNGTPIHTWVRQTNYDVDALIEAAETASLATVADIPAINAYLNSDDRAFQFWGAVGYATLGANGLIAEPQLPGRLNGVANSGNWLVGAMASEALALGGRPLPSMQTLINRMVNNGSHGFSYSALAALSYFPGPAASIETFTPELQSLASGSFRARAILANINQLPARDIFGPDRYNPGLQVNQERRPLSPLP